MKHIATYIAVGFAVTFPILSVFGTAYAEPGKTVPAGPDKTAAVVNRTEITMRDISYRLGIEQAYGNDNATLNVALVSLINDTIEQETASFNGIVAVREEIDSFSRYADEHTKAPDVLQKVKDVFGSDRNAYERIYLLPKIINRKLRDYYVRDPEIHKSERAMIEKAYAGVSGGKTFQDAAGESGLKYKAFDTEEKEAFVPPALLGYMDKPEKSLQDPLVPILEQMQVGDIYKNIVENDHSFSIIRLTGKKGNNYSVEAVSAAKRPFHEWFREQASRLKIEIIDSLLKKSIKDIYPEIWSMGSIIPKLSDSFSRNNFTC